MTRHEDVKCQTSSKSMCVCGSTFGQHLFARYYGKILVSGPICLGTIEEIELLKDVPFRYFERAEEFCNSAVPCDVCYAMLCPEHSPEEDWVECHPYMTHHEDCSTRCPECRAARVEDYANGEM